MRFSGACGRGSLKHAPENRTPQRTARPREYWVAAMLVGRPCTQRSRVSAGGPEQEAGPPGAEVEWQAAGDGLVAQPIGWVCGFQACLTKAQDAKGRSQRLQREGLTKAQDAQSNGGNINELQSARSLEMNKRCLNPARVGKNADLMTSNPPL